MATEGDKFQNFAIVSYKGGVGKTTTAIHLAAYLAQKGKTLLIDGDLNRSSLDWARNKALPFTVADARNPPSEEKFSFIVFDLPARPKPAEIEALIRTTFLIVPTTCDALSIRPTLKMIREFDENADTIYGMHYKILLTIVPPPPSDQGQAAQALLEKMYLPIFKSQIRRFSAFQKAALLGVTVDKVPDDKYRNIAWKCYEEAWEELPIQLPQKTAKR